MNKLMRVYNKLLEYFGRQNWWPTISKNRRFEIIVGAILTQNTSWRNVEKAIKNLNDANLISAKKLSKVNTKKLASLIKSAGYYNQKAERLKIIAKFLLKNKNPTREELLDVKGIGPETADSILLYAFNKPVFVIDAYTKRIMQRLGYKQESYEELQRLFESSLPKNYRLFNEYHALLVELGKHYCNKKPVCKNCPIKDLCKTRKINK